MTILKPIMRTALEKILTFSQDRNADETYAQIRDFDSPTELDRVADDYEAGRLQDLEFCEKVEKYFGF